MAAAATLLKSTSVPSGRVILSALEARGVKVAAPTERLAKLWLDDVDAMRGREGVEGKAGIELDELA